MKGVEKEKYDVTVIGGGPGGYVAAIRAARLGGKVALIEKDQLGGTCLNRGCIPTKTLIHGAEIFRNIKSADTWGISVSDVKIDITKLLLKKSQVVENLRQGLKQLMDVNKIEVFNGFGQIMDPEKVEVICEEGRKEIATKSIILATGSEIQLPPILGIDLPGILNSDDILNLEEIPGEIVVIGAGVMGLEFASLYASLGSKVTVLESQSNMLPMVDEEIVKRLIPLWKRLGIKIELETSIESIEESGGRLLVHYQGKKGKLNLECDKVFVATGRKPCINEKILGGVGVEVENRVIKVNDNLETNIPNIYAVGDIVSSPTLAHVASAEGLVAAENAMGLSNQIQYGAIPGCIFSYPEVAFVGLTEKAAKEQYDDIKVCKIPFSSNGRVQSLGETFGMLKMIMDTKAEKIVGAHIFGPGASELLGEIGLAINNGLTVQEIAHTIHNHPSISELIAEAAHVLMGSPIHTA